MCYVGDADGYACQVPNTGFEEYYGDMLNTDYNDTRLGLLTS